jgi:hypothetical protein
MRVFDDRGNERDATFEVETFEVENSVAKATIVLDSRGGSKGARNARNIEYAAGLEILLDRLKRIGATIEAAHIATARTKTLPPEQTRLDVERRYPFSLESDNIPDLRRALSKAQTTVGQTKGAKGGNPTKRIRVHVAVPRSAIFTKDQLGYFLKTGLIGLADAHIAGGVAEIANAAAGAEEEGFFNAKNDADERRKIFRAIAQRQGQPAFRQKLLVAYGGACAMTGCNAEPALEAAHILPYKGDYTHHVQNGLLLRADLHTLFDRGLLAIDTREFSIIVAKPLQGTTYMELHDKLLRLPPRAVDRPSREALDQHMLAAGL